VRHSHISHSQGIPLGGEGEADASKVVDKCPECGVNGLDLFDDAFAKIADPSVGKLTVSWTVEACGISQPLIVRNKTGTSKWWWVLFPKPEREPG